MPLLAIPTVVRRRRWIVCRLIFSLGLVAVAGSGLADEQTDVPTPVCSTDFEKPDKPGLYKTLERHKLLEVVEGQGVNGSHAIKATYVGGERGSSRIVTSFVLPQKLDEATLVYDVKFDRDFQFVKGGKLHGLGPEKPITGGRDMKPDGWSARAMFDADGLKSYVYCQNKEGKYGKGPERRIKYKFQKGRYYSVCIYVKLNQPASKANGVVRIYVNGKGVAEHRAIRFRSVEGENTRISRLLFSTFHGGHDPSWAPKDGSGKYVNVHAYFDNLAVYDGLHLRKKPGAEDHD